MKWNSGFARRGFLGAALVSAGAAMGWITRKLLRPSAPRKPVNASLDSRFAYDVSEFETTDPELLLYRPAGEFDTGFKRVKRIEAVSGNKVLVAGDRIVKLFDASGLEEMKIGLSRPPHCIHAASEDEWFIGLGNHFEVYDSAGKQKWRSERLGEKTYLTALTTHDDRVYLADAGTREVLIIDRQTGAFIDRFGKRDASKNNPGFNVPSPYFDLMIGKGERLCVSNPGRLRVETYTLDGRFESAWGEPGMKIDRFCGCCNPVYFTITPQGDYITSEKGLARINVYSVKGEFKGAVAGPDTLVEDRELAKRACQDCSVGAGFDVAMGLDGRVLALDPFRNVVRSFVPIQKT